MPVATTYVHRCPEGCLSGAIPHVVVDAVDPDTGVYFHTVPRCAWTRVELVLMASVLEEAV